MANITRDSQQIKYLLSWDEDFKASIIDATFSTRFFTRKQISLESLNDNL